MRSTSRIRWLGVLAVVALAGGIAWSAEGFYVVIGSNPDSDKDGPKQSGDLKITAGVEQGAGPTESNGKATADATPYVMCDGATETTAPTNTGAAAAYPSGSQKHKLKAGWTWNSVMGQDPGESGWWHGEGAWTWDPSASGSSTTTGSATYSGFYNVHAKKIELFVDGIKQSAGWTDQSFSDYLVNTDVLPHSNVNPVTGTTFSDTFAGYPPTVDIRCELSADGSFAGQNLQWGDSYVHSVGNVEAVMDVWVTKPW